MKKTVVKINWREEIGDLLFIVLGSIFLGLSYALFLIPNHIVPGGLGGLAIVINYLTKISVGIGYVILNIPVFILGIKNLGKRYGIKSLLGIISSSFFIDFFNKFLSLPPATSNKLLSAIYGGVLLGLGLGIVFRGHASTGGTDVIGQVLNRVTNLSVGVGILIVDFLIISLSGIVFGSAEYPLYGYLALFISSKVIDFVLEGWSYAKMTLIITEKPGKIKKVILSEMKRGTTGIRSITGYRRKETEVLLVVVARKEIPVLKQYVKKIDPNAFVIITDVYEVLGRGFKPRTSLL